MKQPDIRQHVHSSELVLGGPVSFNMIATTAKFRNENPKLYASFLSALQEATDFINADKARRRRNLPQAVGRQDARRRRSSS